MNRHARRLTALLVAAVCVGACQYDPHAHLYTTAKPAMSEVAGVYKLTSETLLHTDFSQFSGHLCRVQLNADGTFVAENVPPWGIESPDRSFVGRLLSGSGTWRIDPLGEVGNGWSHREVWGVYLDSPTVKLAAANLTGSKSPYGLLFSLGDPDSGEALILSRER